MNDKKPAWLASMGPSIRIDGDSAKSSCAP